MPKRTLFKLLGVVAGSVAVVSCFPRPKINDDLQSTNVKETPVVIDPNQDPLLLTQLLNPEKMISEVDSFVNDNGGELTLDLSNPEDGRDFPVEVFEFGDDRLSEESKVELVRLYGMMDDFINNVGLPALLLSLQKNSGVSFTEGLGYLNSSTMLPFKDMISKIYAPVFLMHGAGCLASLIPNNAWEREGVDSVLEDLIKISQTNSCKDGDAIGLSNAIITVFNPSQRTTPFIPSLITDGGEIPLRRNDDSDLINHEFVFDGLDGLKKYSYKLTPDQVKILTIIHEKAHAWQRYVERRYMGVDMSDAAYSMNAENSQYFKGDTGYFAEIFQAISATGYSEEVLPINEFVRSIEIHIIQNLWGIAPQSVTNARNAPKYFFC